MDGRWYYNKQATMSVAAYCVTHGHLHVWGFLHDPSDDKIEQSERHGAQAWREGRLHRAWAPKGLFNVMGREWEAPRAEAYEWTEVQDAERMAEVRAMPLGDERKTALRRLVKTREARYRNVTEVYGFLFDKGGIGAVAFAKGYAKLGNWSTADAKALIARSVVTCAYDAYNLPGVEGPAVWIAAHGSPQANKHAEYAEDNAEEIARILGGAK
jgi:hypothetical protein